MSYPWGRGALRALSRRGTSPTQARCGSPGAPGDVPRGGRAERTTDSRDRALPRAPSSGPPRGCGGKRGSPASRSWHEGSPVRSSCHRVRARRRRLGRRDLPRAPQCVRGCDVRRRDEARGAGLLREPDVSTPARKEPRGGSESAGGVGSPRGKSSMPKRSNASDGSFDRAAIAEDLYLDRGHAAAALRCDVNTRNGEVDFAAYLEQAPGAPAGEAGCATCAADPAST